MEKVTTLIVWSVVFCLGITLNILPFYVCDALPLIGQLLASAIFIPLTAFGLFGLIYLLRDRDQASSR